MTLHDSRIPILGFVGRRRPAVPVLVNDGSRGSEGLCAVAEGRVGEDALHGGLYCCVVLADCSGVARFTVRYSSRLLC